MEAQAQSKETTVREHTQIYFNSVKLSNASCQAYMQMHAMHSNLSSSAQDIVDFGKHQLRRCTLSSYGRH